MLFRSRLGTSQQDGSSVQRLGSSGSAPVQRSGGSRTGPDSLGGVLSRLGRIQTTFPRMRWVITWMSNFPRTRADSIVHNPSGGHMTYRVRSSCRFCFVVKVRVRLGVRYRLNNKFFHTGLAVQLYLPENLVECCLTLYCTHYDSNLKT